MRGGSKHFITRQPSHVYTLTWTTLFGAQIWLVEPLQLKSRCRKLWMKSTFFFFFNPLVTGFPPLLQKQKQTIQDISWIFKKYIKSGSKPTICLESVYRWRWHYWIKALLLKTVVLFIIPSVLRILCFISLKSAIIF